MCSWQVAIGPGVTILVAANLRSYQGHPYMTSGPEQAAANHIYFCSSYQVAVGLSKGRLKLASEPLPGDNRNNISRVQRQITPEIHKWHNQRVASKGTRAKEIYYHKSNVIRNVKKIYLSKRKEKINVETNQNYE